MSKIFFYCLLLASASVAAQEHSIMSMIASAADTGKTDTSAAKLIFQQAIAKANQAKDPYLAGKAFYEMAEMFFRHKNHNHSFGAFFNARDQFVKAGAKKEIAYSLFGLGREQYYRGNYKVAAGHLNFAMREAKLMKLTALESEALEYLGLLYHVMPGTEHKSIAHFKRSLSIKEKLNDQKGMLRMQQKMGDVYYEQTYFDSALHCLTQCIDMAASLKLHHDADISRLNRAATYIRLNKMAEADKDINYIAAKADTSDLNIRIRYHIQRGNYLTAQKKFDEGKGWYQNALAAAGKIGVPEMYGMVYKHMAAAYANQGLYKEAYQFAQQYNNHLTGYYAENVNTIKELEYIFNTTLTKDEIAWLTGENKTKATLLQNERRWRAALLAGAAVLLLLVATVFYLYRKQKSKNGIIKMQADNQQTLMKEIHHRVKNNLQIISSLLDLQSGFIKDRQAAQAIKESRNRVQSMALIHQHLYGDNKVQSIAIDEYINHLAQSLFLSYHIQPGQVAIETKVEKLHLDIDTVIPIGLMLNELISNSLKHAFGSHEKGRIEVTLKKCDEILLLEVKDNGKGFPDPSGSAQGTSFGLRMIKIFSEKLKAGLEMYNSGGACISIRIRKFKITEV